MPLEALSPSDALTSTVLKHLSGTAQRHAFRTEQLAGAAPDMLSVAAPHPVFNLELADIDGKDLLSRARLSGWRYLVRAGERVIAAAEAVEGAGGASPTFSNTNEGPFVASTARGIELAERLDQVRKGRFRLALLRVPALYVLALWLQDQGTSRSDLVIPLSPSPRTLTAEVPLSPARFGDLLADLRRARGKSDDHSN